MIHFWLPESPPASQILDWDPDAEPRRYASGVGHAVIELYRRLAAKELDVTIGDDVPRGARLVVLYANSIESLHPRKAAIRVIRQVRGRYALIRGDAPVNFRLPIRPVLDCMPIQAAARHSHERWLPLLPQRGLLGRRAERFGQIRAVAFKGNPENVPPAMFSESWTAALASRGLSWWRDVPQRTDGSDQEWHDFTSVDAVVCMRNPLKRRDLARKPATRLINAWCAGCIPLADREPGYEELASDGRDVFFVDSPSSCLAVLDRLRADPELVKRIEAGVIARGQDFATDDVLERWRIALVAAVTAPDCRGARSWARAGLAAAAEARQVARRS